MKHGGRVEICVLAGVLLSASAFAVTSAGADSPYNAIVERNVFNLHAPPPPINPADLIKKTPPPKITLTGITTILGRKITFLTIPPSKPGGPPESYSLAEGQAQNEIEVKRIDEKAGVVDVVNHGEAQTLDFDHDGAKPSGAPPGAPPIAMPGASLPPPNITPMPAPGTVIRPLRSLTPRTNPGNNNNNNGLGGASGNATPQSQNSTLTPEEQVALIEIQRYQAIQNNDPIKDLLPPTEMTHEITGKPASPSGF